VGAAEDFDEFAVVAGGVLVEGGVEGGDAFPPGGWQFPLLLSMLLRASIMRAK
jgi:hypothetical protein